MKHKIRHQLARAKRRMECRLAEAVAVNYQGPVTCGKPRYELSDKILANPW